MRLLVICDLVKKFSPQNVCCAFICIYLYNATGIVLQCVNIHFRMSAVSVNTPTLPSSDGEQSVEQQQKSFPVHGDGGKRKKTVRLAIAGGSTLDEDDEHSLP